MYLTVLTLSGGPSVWLAGQNNYEKDLLDELLHKDRYNRHARPIANVSRPIEVTIAFYLTKILGLVTFNAITSGDQPILKAKSAPISFINWRGPHVVSTIRSEPSHR